MSSDEEYVYESGSDDGDDYVYSDDDGSGAESEIGSDVELENKFWEADGIKREEPTEALKIFNQYLEYGKILKPYISDISVDIYKAYKNGASILFEGAQGISLDVDHGIYPHTTSSNTIAGHIASGTGVSFRNIDRVIGVT